MKIQVENQTVLTVSPDSPVGKALYHKKMGDDFDVKIRGESKYYEVIALY